MFGFLELHVVGRVTVDAPRPEGMTLGRPSTDSSSSNATAQQKIS